MKTYSITEQQLQELLKKQRELCAKSAVSIEDYYRGRFHGCIINRDSIKNAPSPSIEELSGDASFDWEGLEKEFYDECVKEVDVMISEDEFETDLILWQEPIELMSWLKNNITKYYK